MKFLKRLILILMAVALFGAGYLLGSRQIKDVSRLLTTVRTEMAEKTSDLEKESRWIRIRIYLFTARHRLASAETALAERNYGMVQKELQKAKKELASAKSLSDPETRRALSRLEGPLDDLINSAKQADPGLSQRLDALRSDFDRAMEE